MSRVLLGLGLDARLVGSGFFFLCGTFHLLSLASSTNKNVGKELHRPCLREVQGQDFKGVGDLGSAEKEWLTDFYGRVPRGYLVVRGLGTVLKEYSHKSLKRRYSHNTHAHQAAINWTLCMSHCLRKCYAVFRTLESPIFSINHFVLYGGFGGELIRVWNPPNHGLLWKWKG